MRLFLSSLIAALWLPPALAQEIGDSALEPKVTIIERGESAIEEFRIGGQLYMIKITPNKGLPYYLIDTDGDGSLETSRNELDDPPVPQWILLRW